MRHGYAGDPAADPKRERERPLLPEGRATVTAIAKAMLSADEIPNVIFTSPFARTTQTADIVGKLLQVQVNVVDDLAPNRPLEDRLLELMSHGAISRLMVVGHVDNTTPAFENFGGDTKWKDLWMGEVRRLKIDRKSGEWSLKWCVKPSDLGLKDRDGGANSTLQQKKS